MKPGVLGDGFTCNSECSPRAETLRFPTENCSKPLTGWKNLCEYYTYQRRFSDVKISSPGFRLGVCKNKRTTVFSMRDQGRSLKNTWRSRFYNLLKRVIYTWKLKQPVFSGCFSWMIPNVYMKNGCFTISIHQKMVVWSSRYNLSQKGRKP